MTILALWLGGVFEQRSGSSAGDLNISVASNSFGPGLSPGAGSGRTAGASCPGIVSASQLGGSAPGGDHNRLVVAAGRSVTWNGTPVPPITLRQYLDLTRQLRPVPTLVTEVRPGADPKVIQEVLQVIQQGLGCRPASL